MLIQEENAQHDRQMEKLARKHQVDDGGESPPAQEATKPYEPTEVEKQLHRLHHANFEPWCETCVQGQGRAKRQESYGGFQGPQSVLRLHVHQGGWAGFKRHQGEGIDHGPYCH